jgi:FKBP-type peptidyl-prolyl cis-trans isomerase
MDRIKILLKKLDNNVPTSLAKRLDGLKNLYVRLNESKKELSANPNDEELKEAFAEITDYLKDYEEDLIDDLEILADAKETAEAEKAKQNAEAEKAKQTAEAEKLEAEKLEAEKLDTEKKSSGGITALILGGVLLVASIGAINIFKNNR